jgi:hypothetical protein
LLSCEWLEYERIAKCYNSYLSVIENMSNDASSNESSERSPGTLRFLECLEDLSHQDEGRLTRNAHALLQDMALVDKRNDESFFDLVVVTYNGQQNFLINHLEDLLEAKVTRELEGLYGQVCSHYEAKQSSIDYRHQNQLGGKSQFVCGEVEFDSFTEILNTLDLPKNGGTFVDLGSATGRAVLTARLTQDFDTCIGLEVLPNLHELALSAERLYDVQLLPKLIHPNVEFVYGDLTTWDWWSQATVVFSHNTCFDHELLGAMERKAKLLQSGSYYIVLAVIKEGAHLEDAFDLVEKKTYSMTWGTSPVYIFRRR